MMMTRERALAIRRIIEQAAASLDDTAALEAPELFAAWAADTEYAVGDRRRDTSNGLLYKCVQAHTSQEGWEPVNTPALWARVAEPGEEWPEWIQPTGAQDAYAKGDKVSYNEKHWISDVDSNVWAPGVYGWTEQ